MKRRVILFLLILLHAGCCANGVAASTSVDKPSVYQHAVSCAELGLYETALEQFEQIKNFSDSNSWANYCRGMIAIQTADDLESSGYIDEAILELEKAMRYFTLLSAAEFQDSDQLSKYCNARRFQLKKLRQSALDEFESLSGVLDSDERYFNILNNVLLPTQAPKEVLPPFLPKIACHATKRIDVFWGPGNEYLKNDKIYINAESSICICAQENGYYLLETTDKNEKIRFWGPALRIMRDEYQEIPQIGQKGRAAYILADAEARMGPGDDYAKSGIYIKKGEKVTAFDAEGLYTMIEYSNTQTQKTVRVWYLSEHVFK